MATKTRGAMPVVAYSTLNCLSSILEDKKEKKCKSRSRSRPNGKLWKAERIMECRNGREEREYLIKWSEFPTWQATWEPEGNLNEALKRSYDFPQPDTNQIDSSCFAFQINVQQALKASGVDCHIYVPFQLDVWRYLSHGKGRHANKGGSCLFEKEDFCDFTLPEYWHYTLNVHGEGVAIDFPLKIRPFLTRTATKNFIVADNGTLTPAPISYQEKLSVYFVKRACNINNV